MWRILLVVVALALAAPSVSTAQRLPDVGELIFNSKDKKYLEEGCTLAYTIKNRHLYCAQSSGGNTKTSHHAERSMSYFEEDVTTVTGQSYVETVEVFPAGSVAERCLVRTLSAISGGYTVGVDGGEAIFATMDGTEDATSTTDSAFAVSLPVYVATPARVTSINESGFVDSAGVVRVSCFYRTYTAPDE